jgi:hypothetical protein
MEAPEGIAEDLVLDTFALAGGAFDGDPGAGRGEDVEAVGSADLVNAEEVGGVADNDDALEIVGTGNDGEAVDGFVGARAFGFGDDVGVRDAGADQILLANAALGVLVAAITAEGDDEWGDSAAVEGLGVIEAGAEDGRGMTVVFCSAEDGYGVSWNGHVAAGIPLDLAVDPADPDESEEDQEREDDQGPAKDRFACSGLDGCR